MAVVIKNISLLLTRFGSDTNYTCTLSVYAADDDGLPTGSVLMAVTRDAEDIDYESYYNFIFTSPLSTAEEKIALVFEQSINDPDNFILWLRSDEQDNALSTVSLIDDGSWQSNDKIQRSYKIYSNYNDISEYDNKLRVKLPDAETKTISFSNRQELYDGFKQNVAIVDDRITLKDIGRRILFYDQNEPRASWQETNRNLPPDVRTFHMKRQFNNNQDNPYNCLCVAITTEGLFYSNNSGGDWLQCPHAAIAAGTVLAAEFGDPANINNNKLTVIVKNVDTTVSYYVMNVDDATATVVGTFAYDFNILAFGTGGVYGLSNGSRVQTNAYNFTSPSPVNKLTYRTVIFALTEAGVYYYNGSTPTLVTGTNTLGSIHDLVHYNGRFYIATDAGVHVSNATASHTTVTEWVGQDPYKTPYLTNIKRTKTTAFAVSDDILYVSQYGGVVKTNDGVAFVSIADGLQPDTDVEKIVVNPVNDSLLHIHAETTKNKIPFVTFIIDQSGSQYAEGAPNQGSIASSIGDAISDSTSDARFQIITFSYPESEQITGSIEPPKKADNLTGGFVPWSVALSDEVSELKPITHHRTPLYEALWASFNGLYNDGSPWSYDKDRGDFVFDVATDDLFRNSNRIVVLITDGRDNYSNRTIESILGSDSKFPGINQLDMKLYVVAYGAHADLDTLSKLRIPDMELLYARDGNSVDATTVTNHIANKEENRYREGRYRRSFSTDKIVYFSKAVAHVSIPSNTSIAARYRVSENRYDLGDFSDYVTLANGNNNIAINQSGRFVEVEFKLHSNNVNASPSVFGIDIDYVTPSRSLLLLNTLNSAGDERINQVHVTTNADVTDDHYLQQETVRIDGKFSPSLSFHGNVFETIKLDHRAIIDRRILEKTSSTDQVVYRALYGAWDYRQNIIVYRNGTEISESNYYINAGRGEIIFPVQNKTSDEIKITISPANQFRLGFEMVNFGENKNVYMRDSLIMYLRETDTINERPAIPLTARQIGDSANTNITIRSLVPGDTASALAGGTAFITVTHVVKFDLPSGSKMLLGMGDFAAIGEDIVFSSHEKTGITPQLQATSASAVNYVTATTQRKGVLFTIQPYTLRGFVMVTTSGSTIKRGDIIIFSIGGDIKTNAGMGVRIQRSSDIENPHYSTDEMAGALRTSIALAVKDSGTPTPADLRKGLPELNFTASSSSEYIHIAAPTTPESTTIDITVTITNSLGIVAERSVATIQLSLRGLDSNTVTSLLDVTFKPEHAGSRKVTIDLPGTGTYQVIARHTGSGYSTRSNAIIVGADSRIFWGDLNTKSCFGNGRQSPDFVYEYARDKAGLDFVAIADPIWETTQTLWDYAQDIASDYNIEGTFVTFLAAEWKPTTQNVGRRVIVFRNDNVPELNRLESSTLPSLYNNISTYRSFVFAQYPAYADGDRNVNWKTIKSTVNSNIETAVEMYSEHGNSESALLSGTNGLNSPAGDSSYSYISDALQQGYRMAFIANSNSGTSRPGLYAGELERDRLPVSTTDTSAINNRGITAVVANNLSRQAIFEAIRAGRTYATTGARIYLEFRSGTVSMGEELEVRESAAGILEEDPEFSIKVIPTSEFATLNLVRVDVNPDVAAPTLKVIRSVSVTSAGFEAILTDTTLGAQRKDARYFLRITQEDGHTAWSSPIYLKYTRGSN